MASCLLGNGTWTTSGKTPDATLGARIYMDIKKHGASSRFVKAGKGLFALSGVQFVGKAEPEIRVQNRKPKVCNGGTTFSFTDCAEKVLRGQGKRHPMHYLEITKIALDNGWLATSGKTPEATMYAQIIQEI